MGRRQGQLGIGSGDRGALGIVQRPNKVKFVQARRPVHDGISEYCLRITVPAACATSTL